MQNEINFRRFLYKNSYLLVVAAWLITISFIIDNYWSGNSSLTAVQKNIQAYVQKEEKDFDNTLKDTAVINKLLSKNYDDVFLDDLTHKKYFLYLYFVNDIGLYNIIFWNTQAAQPTEAILQSTEKTGFVKLANGYYAWRKSVLNKNNVAVSLVPVKWNYVVTNDYLDNSFLIGKGVENNFDIAEEGGGAVVKSVEGKELFSVKQIIAKDVVERNSLVSVWLRIIAVVFIFLFIHFVATYIARNNRLWKAVLFLFTVVLLLRVLSYYFPIPLNFRQFELFAPSVYGANAVLRSLGDLLINALLFMWMMLFAHHHVQEKNIGLQIKSNIIKWSFLVVTVSVLLITTFSCGHVIQSMIADSKISFDVINFFTLNIYSAIGFVVWCCIAIGYFMFSQIIMQLLKSIFANNLIIIYLAVAIGGLIYLTIGLNFSTVTFELCMLGWLLLYLALLNTNYFTLLAYNISSARLVFWLFFFSVSITTVIMLENNKKELSDRKHHAETLSAKADPANETLINSMLTDFRSEFIAPNFERFKDKASSQFLKDSIINGNFSGYTDKYETKIYTFDANEKGLYNNDSVSFNQLNMILNTQAKPTGVNDLFYYDESYDRFSYISRKDVLDTGGKPQGYVFILANPKKNKPEALYIELFSKGHNNDIENSSEYAFALYNNLQLVDNHNDYAFPTRLTEDQVPKNEYEQVKKNDYDELWYKAGPGDVVIIVKQNNFLIESITLFSYLFCSFLLVTGIFWLLNIFIRSRLNKERFRSYWRLTIRNQIHGTVIFISILSFLIIGIATILFFISRYENNNREKLSRTIHVMENEVRASLTDLSIFDDVIKVYDEGYRQKLEQTIARISEIHANDINLYDIDGNLQVSSLPFPYNKGIISTKMDPVAYYHLNKQKEIQYFGEEKIGKLNFVSNYVPVIDETGREYAYLNIPYFISQSKLKQEISSFLVTIINLNAFIFLIAGIVALFITNRITRSFSFISNKMKEVNLGKINAAIDWKRDDEIGQLVKEYNKMVGKLDESAAALAKSEREGAWREMARQVAHEIKNPLTPMKLSLQYLQKAINGNATNVKELTENVARTLVEQIDHLNQIAGEFSQFANIGNIHNEVFDLNECIKAVTQLHAIADKLDLTWKPAVDKVFINADRTHINRLFTNLILNALQAVPEDRSAIIEVNELLHDDKVLITVKDNGSGIPEDLHSKIFTPNFTTKTSGTGLGLAMSKGIVEQAKGAIWFETAPGTGTTFFVELPAQKSET